MDIEITNGLRRRIRRDFEAGVNPAIEVRRQCAEAGIDVDAMLAELDQAKKAREAEAKKAAAKTTASKE